MPGNVSHNRDGIAVTGRGGTPGLYYLVGAAALLVTVVAALLLKRYTFGGAGR